jgi:HD-GYP domain-containing protein (c-di-GMP phosphodiesterase class II)
MADSSRAQLRKLKDEYARNPGSRVFVHLAEAHRKAGELRQAQQVLAEGLRRHVDYPSGLVVLAKVLADQGDDERAAAVWRDVVRLDPENVVALRALADIAEAAGRRDEAMELYRQLVRLENGAPDEDDTQFAPPSFGDDDAEPVPVASAPAREPERAPAQAKSRFSWLVRSVMSGVGEPKEPARPAFNLEEALAEPAGAVAAMEAPAVQAPPAPEPVREEAPDTEVFAEVEAPEQLSASDAEFPPPASAEVREEPAVQIPDEEVEPAVPLPDSETEPTAVVEETPSDEFEGILPVEELNTFEGILPAAAEVDDRIIPGGLVIVGAGRAVELDTTPPELGEVEAPAEEEESEDEEIGREDIESQEEIVADAGIAAELDDEIEDVIGEPEAAGPDDEIEETVGEHAGAVLDEADAPAAEYDGEAAAEPASAIRFEELAQLAYEGGAVLEPAHAPAPDPYAHLRAELFGGGAAEPETDELAGAPAALAEVLVRLLERDGSVMKAESSLRRLLAVALARELGLTAPQQDALALAALLGSLGALSEPGGTDTGRQLAVTLQLLSAVDLPEAAREALAHQYERWDGAGLPAGLKEDAIPFPARVLAVAREAAALLGGRGPSAVVDELQRHAGSAFDPIVVSVLRRVFAQRERHGIGYGWGGRIAVAHPQELRALELAARLHGEGYAAETAGTAAGLREQLNGGALQALVLGADLPDADAGALVREVRGMSATLPVLVVDAGDARRRVELLGAGADVCFPPDADFLEVRATLDALLRRRESAA